MAHAGVSQFADDFESGSHRAWFMTGGAGLDFNKGLARRGAGNAWVRATTGWNAVNTFQRMAPPIGAKCEVSAWLRLSPNVTDGYMAVRGANQGEDPGPVINEIKLVGPTPPDPANAGYKQFRFEFRRPPTSGILFYVGLWGNGRDAWIQIDDVVMECSEGVERRQPNKPAPEGSPHF
jgi:hypothetical protein